MASGAMENTMLSADDYMTRVMSIIEDNWWVIDPKVDRDGKERERPLTDLEVGLQQEALKYRVQELLKRQYVTNQQFVTKYGPQ